jgi:hypothetical protein
MISELNPVITHENVASLKVSAVNLPCKTQGYVVQVWISVRLVPRIPKPNGVFLELRKGS